MVLVAGLSRGLRMQDTEYMTFGMWVDYIIEWNKMNDRFNRQVRDKKGNPVTVRRATQADFDRFC